MALSMIAGGADCGPSNPLQSLSKRFEQDRGLQQDHFGPSRAGSSREAFRTNTSTTDPDASRFFSSNAQPTSEVAYDISTLRAALPPQIQATPHDFQLHQPNPLTNWAAEFTLQQPLRPPELDTPMVMQVNSHPDATVSVSGVHQGAPSIIGHNIVYHNPMMTNMRVGFAPPPLTQVANPNAHFSWDKAFTNQEMAFQSASENVLKDTQLREGPVRQMPHDIDELARTAGLLLDNVRHEQNPKFQNSEFLHLMRKLRDRDMVVEGNQLVENEGRQVPLDVKGKGRASDNVLPGASRAAAGETSTGETIDMPQARFVEHAQQELAQIRQTTEDDANDAYFRQDNTEYQQYWNGTQSAKAPTDRMVDGEVATWDYLQDAWDHFEATTTGIKRVDSYQFHNNNPYLLGDSSAIRTTRQHAMHNGHQALSESVLQLEAAVQRDPSNASAWYELGVKQQENEREHKALQALKRATELDPSHLQTWLALAVSHTNESNRIGTFNAVNEWVSRNEHHRNTVEHYRAQNPLRPEASLNESYAHLIECLITMARSDVDGSVDADTQVALAVLLNTNEDYIKARDCFLAALAVRPEDWLLYNRVGATMANSGSAEDALQYYYTALDLNPGYIRARFNLGISCINLRRYEEAAGHILDALVLQENDGVLDPASSNEKRGVTSTALWDSLKTTCLHMQRIDLATLCDRQDLEGFRANFLA